MDGMPLSTETGNRAVRPEPNHSASARDRSVGQGFSPTRRSQPRPREGQPSETDDQEHAERQESERLGILANFRAGGPLLAHLHRPTAGVLGARAADQERARVSVARQPLGREACPDLRATARQFPGPHGPDQAQGGCLAGRA